MGQQSIETSSRDVQPSGRNGSSQQGESQLPTTSSLNSDAITNKSKELENQSEVEDNASRSELKRRPDDGGTVGKSVSLHVNHFEIEFKPATDKAFRYDFSISVKGKYVQLSKLLRWEIFKKLVAEIPLNDKGNILLHYDGNTNIYTVARLDDICKEVKIEENGEEQSFTVNIKHAEVIDMKFTEFIDMKKANFPIYKALQVLDTALKNRLWKQSIYSKRHLFDPNPEKDKISDELVVWKGYQASFRPCWKITLNLDLSFKAFYNEQSVLDLLKSTFNCIPKMLNKYQFEKFNNVMKGLKITTNHLKFRRKQVVKRIVADTAKNSYFNHNGEKINIAQYFSTKYKIEIIHAGLPLIEVGQNKNKLPLELCTIMEQPNNHKLSPEQQREMIKLSAIKPPERMKMIKKTLENRQFSDDEYLKEFGISVSNEMMVVEGRLLPPPFINEIEHQIEPGKFKFNSIKEFRSLSTLPRFCIVLPERPKRQDVKEDMAKTFFNSLFSIVKEKEKEKEKHSNWDSNKDYDFKKISNSNEIKSLIKKILSERNIDLVFWILPSGDEDDWYKKIKYHSDGQLMTQCVKDKLVKKCRYNALQNIVLKLNAKLGGTSTSIHMKDEILQNIFSKNKFMLLGADVTHPAPSAKHLPSYAGVVASLNDDFSQYAGLLQCQKPREMVEKLLKKYKEKNSGFPTKMIYYRDGVSETQFEKVLILELDAIQKACKSMKEVCEPQITVITVQKRHHTRLFQKVNKNYADSFENVCAGTVVDKKIVHPFNFDFFLCSHEGIQGTSRPAQYCVLYDDSDFSSDFLQLFTYHLCYTYARCTRSVSYPPPTYYSHHLCMRARHYQDEYLNSVHYDSSQSSGDSNESVRKIMEDMNKILDEKNQSMLKEHLMYFM